MSEDGATAACSCEVFAVMALSGDSGGNGRCHHTVFVLKHLDVLLRLPAYEPGEPVPIGSAIQLQVGYINSGMKGPRS